MGGKGGYGYGTEQRGSCGVLLLIWIFTVNRRNVCPRPGPATVGSIERAANYEYEYGYGRDIIEATGVGSDYASIAHHCALEGLKLMTEDGSLK